MNDKNALLAPIVCGEFVAKLRSSKEFSSNRAMDKYCLIIEAASYPCQTYSGEAREPPDIRVSTSAIISSSLRSTLPCPAFGAV